jgi:hypothetical protein
VLAVALVAIVMIVLMATQVCTEWDMFAELDFERIFASMQRPRYNITG